MKPRRQQDEGQDDMFRARLEQIVNPAHELCRLARAIDWGFIAARCDEVYSDAPGQPPLPTRLMAGLAILKHTYDLSDEALAARWLENPYFQLFCGETFFRHELPFDRSSMTRWRQRMGEARIAALLQESLAVAVRTGGADPRDLAELIVDTTVQEKAVAFPTDARLAWKARVRLVRLAKRHGIRLRQSYARVGKMALQKHQRYAHARHFKRAGRCLRTLRSQLGRVIRDIDRKVRGRPELNAALRPELFRAGIVLRQRRGERGPKIYALHAPEVECIGKGKAHKPYEFGVKVSVATPIRRQACGQLVVHAMALPGRPYDGHTLATVLPAIERLSGIEVRRVIADRGYRGHKCPAPWSLRVFIAGQKCRVTDEIRRQLRRRSAVEPVIGHMKAEHRMARNHLAGTEGDAINAVLAAAGYNFRRLLAWLALLVAALIARLAHTLRACPTQTPA